MPTWSQNISGPGQQSGANPSTFNQQVQGDPAAGYGALNFQAIAPGGDAGYNDNLAYGYSNAAKNILAGSLGARGELIKGYESEYRRMAEGVSGAQSEYGDRMRGEIGSQGYSPDLVRRMLLNSDRASQAQIGSSQGEMQSRLHGQLAELFKGTATELTSLQRDQMAQILQAYLAKEARRATKKSGELGFLGGIGSSVIDYFGSTQAGSADSNVEVQQ